jgi:DNA-binding NarL/FixJ family response regulator
VGEVRQSSDAQAIQLIKQVANVTSRQDHINAEKDERNRVLARLKENGLSVRQIARLTDINRNIIQRAGKL